jgi:hypothetical protein
VHAAPSLPKIATAKVGRLGKIADNNDVVGAISRQAMKDVAETALRGTIGLYASLLGDWPLYSPILADDGSPGTVV